MEQDSYKKALSYAYRLLAQRSRSIRETSNRLQGKKYSPKTIDKVLEELKKRGQLDDLKFAKSWVENRLVFNPKGEVAIRYELREKGLSLAIIDKVMEDLEPNFDEYTVAKTVAEQRLGELKNMSFIKRKKKIHDLLQRRGFRFETIERILYDIR